MRWTIALILILATACETTTPAPSPTVVVGAPSSTPFVLATPPSTTPTPASTPFFVDIDPARRGWGCVADDPRIGEPSLCSRFVRADLDGDGVPDDIAFWLPGHETQRQWPVLWTVRLRTRTTTATTQTAYPVDRGLIGTADAKGDGRPFALVDIGHGASTTWVGVLAFDGTTLRMNVVEPMLLFSGSVRHGDAIECRRENGRDEFVHRQVSDHVADDQWDMVEHTYVWHGADLVLVSVTKSTLAYRGRQPTPVGRYWGLDCGPIRSEAWAWN